MVAVHKFTLLQILRTLEDLDKPVVSKAVADAAGASREAARESLQRLKRGGYADAARRGGKTLFTVTERGSLAVQEGAEIEIGPAKKWERGGYIATTVSRNWQWRELQEALGTQPVRAKGRVVDFHMDVDRLGIDDDDSEQESELCPWASQDRGDEQDRGSLRGAP